MAGITLLFVALTVSFSVSMAFHFGKIKGNIYISEGVYSHWISESDDLNISTVSPPGKNYIGLIIAGVLAQSVTGVSGLQSNRQSTQTRTCL